jgi:hypothetical protein
MKNNNKKQNRPLAYQLATVIPNETLSRVVGGSNARAHMTMTITNARPQDHILPQPDYRIDV